MLHQLLQLCAHSACCYTTTTIAHLSWKLLQLLQQIPTDPGSWYIIQIHILRMDPQGCYMLCLMLVIKIISIFCDDNRYFISYKQLENLRFSRLFWVRFNWMSLCLNNRYFVNISSRYYLWNREWSEAFCIWTFWRFNKEVIWVSPTYCSLFEWIQWEGKGPPSSQTPLYCEF
jgi:hypothetical protein